MQIPMLVSVWDDGHGISVPKKYQTTNESISEILKVSKEKMAETDMKFSKRKVGIMLIFAKHTRKQVRFVENNTFLF